jgi:proliferating cell nuclear antigen PCNA
MKLVINNSVKATKFSNIFNNLKYFTETMNLHFSENGLYVQGMDKTHCCLFEFKINKSWFDIYEFDEIDAHKIGISTIIMHKVLNIRNEAQSIIINYSGIPDKLSICFSNFNKETIKSNSTFNKNIDMPLIDIDVDILSIPHTDYEAEITIGSAVMREIVEELSIFNDKLEITLNEDVIILKSSGIEGELGITIKNDDIIEYAIIEDGNLKQSYSLKFFKLMTSFNKLSNEVNLNFSGGAPMLMFYSLDTDEPEINYIKFHLAPYIDD